MVLLVIMRNYSMFPIYGFELAVREPKYLCLEEVGDDPTNNWSTCSPQDICSSNLNYKVDQYDDLYFHNWYIQLNLICEPRTSYTIIASIYFLGYGLGVVLYWMPDKIGRKGTMIWVLPI